MKRFIFTVAAVLIVVIMAACSRGNSKNTEQRGAASTLSMDEPGWKTDTSPITFDWYLHFSWFTSRWGEGDIVSDYVTEKTGVDINFVVPAGSEAEKLNTLIAGGQLPDFITIGWWEGQVLDLIDGELVYALDELSKQYDPYFMKVASPERLGWYRQEDGHVYGYPNASYSPSDYEKYDDLPSNQTFLVSKYMYEALGSPSMRTPEEFLDTLRRAQEKFPKINGQPMIPFGMHEFGDTGNYSLEAYIQNFLAIPYERDGKLIDRFADPEYKRWLAAFRQAREEGLIRTDVFVDRRAQMEEKIAQGRYFSMLYQRSDMGAQQSALYQRDPESIYMAIDGPASSKMDDPRLAGQGLAGWTITLISKNVKDPARAIRFMSYLMSEEGQKDLYLGKEGVTWETKDGKDQFLPEVAELLNSDRGAFDKKYGASSTYWMLMDNPMLKQWEGEPVPPFKQMEEWTYPYTVSYAPYEDLNPPVDSELGITGLKIGELQGRVLPELLNAKSEAEFDSIWTDWISKKADLGLADLQVYQQKQMEKNKQKLGME